MTVWGTETGQEEIVSLKTCLNFNTETYPDAGKMKYRDTSRPFLWQSFITGAFLGQCI